MSVDEERRRQARADAVAVAGRLEASGVGASELAEELAAQYERGRADGWSAALDWIEERDVCWTPERTQPDRDAAPSEDLSCETPVRPRPASGEFVSALRAADAREELVRALEEEIEARSFVPRPFPPELAALAGEDFTKRAMEAAAKIEPLTERVYIEICSGPEVCGSDAHVEDEDEDDPVNVEDMTKA